MLVLGLRALFTHKGIVDNQIYIYHAEKWWYQIPEPGISPARKDKIFQPFFTIKPTEKGTGLGLSLAYDMIKVHEGAEFMVHLPVKSR